MDKIANIKIGQQNVATDSTRSISSIIEEKLLKNKKKKTRDIEQIELTVQQMMLPLQTVEVPSTTGAIVHRNHLGSELNKTINLQSQRVEDGHQVMTPEAKGSWATARADTKITDSGVENRQAQDKILSQNIKGDEFNISNDIVPLNKKIESEVQNILQSAIPLIKQTSEQVFGLGSAVDASATLSGNQQHINSSNITDGQDGTSGTLIYRFQQWGDNHSVIISEHSEGAMTLKPSDELVENRLTHALRDNNDAGKWRLDQNSQDRNHPQQEKNDEEDD